MRIKSAICWSLLLSFGLSPWANAEDQFFKGSLQGTKYEFTITEGDIDPASPERAFVTIDVTTVRSLDIILAVRRESGEESEQPIQSKRHRINATPGTPRKEKRVIYLDEVGLDSPGQGLMALLLRFPLSQFDQNLITKYESDGQRITLQELPGQFMR